MLCHEVDPTAAAVALLAASVVQREVCLYLRDAQGSLLETRMEVRSENQLNALATFRTGCVTKC